MADIVTVQDVESFTSGMSSADVQLLVDGANARAARVAPCLVADPPPAAGVLAEARLILVGALRRWVQAGSGEVSQQTAGPFSQTLDTRQRSGYNLWPSEITDLQSLCSTAGAFEGRAFEVNTLPANGYGMGYGYAYADGYWAQPNLWVPLV